MRPAAVLVVVSLALARGARAEPAPEERATVALVPSKREVFVGEAFRIDLVVRYDPVWFAEKAVGLFPAPLDLPFHVETRGFPDVAGARALPDAGGAHAGRPVRFALGDGPVEADLEAGPRGERSVVTVSRRYVAEAPGTISLRAPSLRFAWAERFRDDLVRGRVAIDVREVRVAGEPLDVVVRPLPTEGRPEGFGGAVGRFEVRGEVDDATVSVGEPFALRLRISGEGNLPFFDPPRPSFPGFHVLGVRDDRGTPLRTVTLDLAATEPRDAALPIALPFFDPAARAYASARGEPVRIRVEGEAPARSTPEAPASGEEPRFPLAVLVGALVGLAAFLVVLARLRARTR